MVKCAAFLEKSATNRLYEQSMQFFDSITREKDVPHISNSFHSQTMDVNTEGLYVHSKMRD